MTKTQLIEEAKQLGIEVTTTMTKSEIESEIQKHEPKFDLVSDLEDLKFVLEENKLNPMEKVMAVELLAQGFEFYCQYRIDCPEGWKINGRQYFVVDFFIPKLNLVVETDGKIHMEEKNQVLDRYKDLTLTSMGYRIFRFSWDDVTGESGNISISDFLDKLIETLLKETT